MTDPRTPDGQPTEPGDADSPTQAWPSMATPAPDTAPATPATTAPSTAAEPAASSPYEPADTLPSTRVGVVDATPSGAPTPARRPGVRWLVAGLAVVLVAVASFAIVSLVGGRPAASVAMGYMPATTVTYSEVRLDFPGDQRQKLAAFLKPFPGFSDPSAIEPKLNDVFDRIVRAATDGKKTWTSDIQPWFGGQLAFGSGLPDPAALTGSDSTAGQDAVLFVATVSNRSKAVDFVLSVGDAASINRTAYNGADLFTSAEPGGPFAVAVTDSAMLGGSTDGVKAAIDSGGKTDFVNGDEVKAALKTVDKDYVTLSVIRVHAYAQWIEKLMALRQPGALDQTQLDETIVEMIPAWFANVGRFENDAFVATSVGPAGKIGYDTSNRQDQLVGHVPSGTILFASEHDVGSSLAAILAKFRGLPEAQTFFSQLDQGLSLLGGFDAVVGWWGDSAFVVSPLADGTIGGGLVIHPKDATAADRLFTTLNGFLALGGSSAGVTTRTADHNGTKVTIVDLSTMSGMTPQSLPPGYKAEVAWAANADVAVIGYGEAFVNAVLDAGPGHSLNDDARFKTLLDRAGAENIAVSFLDIQAIRKLVEPLAQSSASADEWAYYTREIQPYLAPIDALISTGRKDGGLDRGVSILTAH